MRYIFVVTSLVLKRLCFTSATERIYSAQPASTSTPRFTSVETVAEPQALPAVDISAPRAFVKQLLALKCAFPPEHLNGVIDTLCNSVSANTLISYFRIVRVAERYMGTEFHTWLPFSDSFIQGYVAQLLATNVSASTVNAHISALGTFATWAGCARPRSELIAYLIKGKGATKGLPPKARVHDFPWEAAKRAVELAVAAVHPDSTRLALLYLCVAMLLLVWPARPHSLLSC